MRDIRNELVEMLRNEVKPAVGCTEPVALALACAKAKELLGEEVIDNKMLVSNNIFKNGMGVGIPGSKILGLKVAACMGIVGGKSADGLSVLEGLTEEEVRESEKYLEEHTISVEPTDSADKIYLEVMLKGANHEVLVKIRGRHDNFTYLAKDGEVILDNEPKEVSATETSATEERKETLMDNATVAEIVDNVEKMDFEDIKFLLDGIKMNRAMAEVGLREKTGVGTGFGIKEAIKAGELGDDLVNYAMMFTSAASDARMSGVKMPVMSSNGSGNHGLTAILPIAAYNERNPQSDERVARALAISHLITAYIKNFTGRLSPMCGCGVAAAIGCTAGLSWLMDAEQSQIEGAMENMIANLSGMICDGAKPGCACKLATASSAAVQNAILAKRGCIVPGLNGIVGRSVDESVRALGCVGDEGMSVTDNVILDVMNEMNK